MTSSKNSSQTDCLLPRRRGDYAKRHYHADVVMAAVGNHHADTMSHDHCHLSKVNESKKKLKSTNLSIAYSKYISECKKYIDLLSNVKFLTDRSVNLFVCTWFIVPFNAQKCFLRDKPSLYGLLLKQG